MLSKTVLALAFIAVVQSEDVRPCDLSDLSCIRTTIAERAAGYSPYEGLAKDFYQDDEQVFLTCPTFNSTYFLNSCQYTGFAASTIEDFYLSDEGYTIVTVNIPKLFWGCTFSGNFSFTNQPPIQVSRTFGRYAFDNVTLTVIFPGTEEIITTEARTFTYLGGELDYDISDLQTAAASNEQLESIVDEISSNWNVLILEAFVGIGPRVSYSYAVSNLVIPPQA